MLFDCLSIPSATWHRLRTCHGLLRGLHVFHYRLYFIPLLLPTPQSNTLANTTLSRVFGGRADGGKRVSAAFALLRLCFCLAASLGSLIARLPFVYHSSALRLFCAFLFRFECIIGMYAASLMETVLLN